MTVSTPALLRAAVFRSVGSPCFCSRSCSLVIKLNPLAGHEGHPNPPVEPTAVAAGGRALQSLC
jgi:hypothetical protein